MAIRSGFSEGEVCWADLHTADVAAAKEFYSGIFGWRYEDEPTPDGRSYAKAFLGSERVSVIAPQNPQQLEAGAPGQWNVYFAAGDAAALAAEVPHAGGTVDFGPEAVTDTGVMVFLTPPGGGTTGVWQYPQDDGGTYTTLMVAGMEVAGIATVPKTERNLEPGWQVYFGVPSVAEAVAVARAAGGVVLVEPEDIEDAGTIATLRDPQGGVFSLLEA